MSRELPGLVRHGLLWLGAVMLALAVGSVAASSTIQVGFSPQRVDASVGATVALDVTVANVDPDPGLGAYDLTLRFDPAVVRLDSFTDSGFVTNGQNVVICVTGQIDNAAGSVNATCTAIQLFGAPGVSTVEAVALLHASFTTLAAGTSSLTISGSLSEPSGRAIAASFGSGTIRVTTAAPAPSSTAASTAIARSSPASQPAVTAAVSPTRVTTTPIAGTAARTTPAASAGASKVPATGDGGGHGTSFRILIALLSAVAVTIVTAGSILGARRLRRKKNR